MKPLNNKNLLPDFNYRLPFLSWSLLIIIISALFSSCTSGEPEDKSELVKTNKELFDELQNLKSSSANKDSSLQKALEIFNEIEENLALIKKKEGIVSLNYKDNVEEQTDRTESIINDIQIINGLIDKNKQKIRELNRIIGQKDLKLSSLTEMVSRLEADISLKDQQIVELKEELRQLQISHKVLSMVSTEQMDLIELQEGELKKGFYCFGTKKELIENGVITKEGGFIGLGSSQKLKDDFNRGYFTQVDIMETENIPLMVKKAKILTSHPPDSYKFEGTEEKVNKLTITNNFRFWEVSKYLVILTE